MRCGLSSHPFHTNLHCHPLLISLIWIPCQLILENNRFPTTVYKLLQTPARPQMHAEECLGVIQDQHRYCKHFQFWKQIQSWLSSPLKATCTAAYKLEATRVTFSLDERYVVSTGRKNRFRRKSSIFHSIVS